MSSHEHATADLTKNQSLVMEALARATGPLSAYTILDQLRDEGFRAPLQVYRALDKLVEYGLVHRLESLNAFVACRHPGCESHEATVFMICRNCGTVSEITDPAISKRLVALAADAGFSVRESMIELRGRCSACAAA